MLQVRKRESPLQSGDVSHQIKHLPGAGRNPRRRLCQGWPTIAGRPGTAGEVESAGQPQGSSRGGTHSCIAHGLDGKEKSAVDDDAIPHALQPTTSKESNDASGRRDEADVKTHDGSDDPLRPTPRSL